MSPSIALCEMRRARGSVRLPAERQWRHRDAAWEWLLGHRWKWRSIRFQGEFLIHWNMMSSTASLHSVGRGHISFRLGHTWKISPCMLFFPPSLSFFFLFHRHHRTWPSLLLTGIIMARVDRMFDAPRESKFHKQKEVRKYILNNP